MILRRTTSKQTSVSIHVDVIRRHARRESRCSFQIQMSTSVVTCLDSTDQMPRKWHTSVGQTSKRAREGRIFSISAVSPVPQFWYSGLDARWSGFQRLPSCNICIHKICAKHGFSYNVVKFPHRVPECAPERLCWYSAPRVARIPGSTARSDAVSVIQIGFLSGAPRARQLRAARTRTRAHSTPNLDTTEDQARDRARPGYPLCV